jgi:hypothetical protein
MDIMANNKSADADPMTTEVQVSDYKSLAEFTLFPKLPLEVRHTIWHESLSPRFLTIARRSKNRARRMGISANYPTILHVNREARTLGLKHYELCFSSLVGGPSYFNPLRDVNLKSHAPLITPYCSRQSLEELKYARRIAYTTFHVELEDTADHLERLLHFRHLDVYFVGSEKADVIRKARGAATTWAGMKYGGKASDDAKTGDSEEIQVPRPVVCFGDCDKTKELLKNPEQWDRVVKTSLLRGPLV